MPSIWDPAVRNALVMRVAALTPTHTAKWGTFDVAGMLAHVNDAARMATGALAVAPKAPPFLRWPPVRYLFIHVLPMPKGAPTAPELLARTSGAELSREQASFAHLFGALDASASLASTHPAFGPLSRHDWGVLLHKHTDHHLRQFGA